MNILQIDSGLFGDQSVSNQLTAKVVARLSQENKDASVTRRDLVNAPVAHLDAEILMAGGTEAAQRSTRQQEQFDLTETLLQEMFDADVLVLGAPMYNFTIPTQLKAWVDRVAQAGRTFRYTENGPEGLLTGKRAIIASARGGFYSEGAAAAMEHQESYLKTLLGFIGITDVTVVRAEGVNISDEQRLQAINAASDEIAQLDAEKAA